MEDRVAIPIHNETGELVAYTGRWINEEPPEGKQPDKLSDEEIRKILSQRASLYFLRIE